MASSRARVLPPQQWEEHKEDIVKLYLDKKYTLKVVREKLAKRGFHATEGQFRTRFKFWGVRKPRQGTALTAPDASTGGQNGNNSPIVDASVAGDDGAIAVQIVEDDQRSSSAVMGSQKERDQAFVMNAARVPEGLHTVSPQILQQSSFGTQYDLEARASQSPSYSMRYGLVGNEAWASQAPSYNTRNDLVGNEARASQAPSYSTRYDLVSNEAHTSQTPSYSTWNELVGNEACASQTSSYSTHYGLVDNEDQPPPSFQYSTSGSNALQHAPPFGLQNETAGRHSDYSLGLSLEQHGDTLADNFWNSTESINQQPDTASRYG